MEYALKGIAEGTFEQVTTVVERSVEAHGFFVVSAIDVHVTLAHKGFRIHPVRIYEVRSARESGDTPHGGAKRAEVASGRISVFMQDDDVIVAAIRPGVITDLFLDPGLESYMRELERGVIAIVRDAVVGGVEESEPVS